jgi:hypothetical protein
MREAKAKRKSQKQEYDADYDSLTPEQHEWFLIRVARLRLPCARAYPNRQALPERAEPTDLINHVIHDLPVTESLEKQPPEQAPALTPLQRNAKPAAAQSIARNKP